MILKQIQGQVRSYPWSEKYFGKRNGAPTHTVSHLQEGHIIHKVQGHLIFLRCIRSQIVVLDTFNDDHPVIRPG